MDSLRSTLPQEGPIRNQNADSSVGSEGRLPMPSWPGMDSYMPTLPKESSSFNVGSSVRREGPPPSPSWCMDSFGSTLPKEGPTSFNADADLLSVRSEGLPPPPFWGMDCYRPTLPREGTRSFNVGIPPSDATGNLSSYSQVDSSWTGGSFTRLLLENEDFSFDSSPWTNSMPSFKEPVVRAVGREAPIPPSNAIENLSSYAQVDSSCPEGSFTRLLLGNEDFSFDSFPWTNSMPSFKEPVRDGLEAAATVPIHNQNEVGASSWGTSPFQFSIATQDHPRQLDTRHHFDMFNWPMASLEKDRHASLSVPTENVVCNTSVATTSTDQVLQKEGDQVNNLNKTQRHTTPRRRKHMPKVIKEDNQQRTPKTKNVLRNENCPSVKRKYVRRNNLAQTEVGSTSKEEQSSQKTKRPLNFDLRKDQSLRVDGETSNLSGQLETTDSMPLVQYEGDCAVVPYEAQHENTENRWDAERKLFQGRIESFTARMHLIQGNRRFSKWKGSVLDSIIGVFLTQNVSDHLSSSAFMSLVAKFPNHKESPAETCFKSEPGVTPESRLDHTSLDLLNNVLADLDQPNHCLQWYDEDLSWLKPKSKTETSRTSIFPTTLLHADQTTLLEFQKPIDMYKPTNGGASVGFLGTAFNPSNEMMSTIPEKATGDFKLFEEESIFFMDPGWSSVLNKGKSMEPKTIFNKVPSSHVKDKAFNWDSLRRQVEHNSRRKQRCVDAFDSLDFEALWKADVKEISDAIKARGFNNMLAKNIKAFLDRLMREHGKMDLEWLRDAPQDKAKEYLMSIDGIGLKSTECVRLLTLHHIAFPVDTNVARIAVRLGWVPLQPLPESLQLHRLEKYPMLESIQRYLWPRLCKLDQPTLYELHYQLITFGKVFCTKNKPNCNACPMRGECKHFESACASARQALPWPEVGRNVTSTISTVVETKHVLSTYNSILFNESGFIQSCEPIVEEPATPETEMNDVTESDMEDIERNDVTECDMEDACRADPDDIPTINLNLQGFTQNECSYMQENMELQEYDLSKALVAINPNVASIPAAKLKNVSRLRTEHLVYELPDSHPLLEKMDKREQDDPSPYLLAIWTPGETASNSTREADKQIVQGTLLVPCRTAMKGSFPLNGTYFQVNEMFADHESSINPISVPRSLLWNLPRKMVYFGTSATSIFRGMSMEEIQKCFWRGFVCVRGFDQNTRTPRPLIARLHFSARKMVETKSGKNQVPS